MQAGGQEYIERDRERRHKQEKDGGKNVEQNTYRTMLVCRSLLMVVTSLRILRNTAMSEVFTRHFFTAYLVGVQVK
jgi:hypothetical protein